MPIDSRTSATANVLLELDGKRVGFVRSVEGGEPYFELVKESPAVGSIGAKHAGALQYAPITITVGLGMDPAIVQWVMSSLNRQPARKSGALIYASVDFQEKSRLSFTDALITEVRLPTFDASAKEAGYLTVTFQPLATRLTTSTAGTQIQAPTKQQKPWVASGFRLQIPGLDAACKKVSTIGSIAVRFSDSTPPGGLRNQVTPGSQDISNPIITASDTVAGDFASWFDDNAVRHNATEKTATIDGMSPDSATVLFTITLNNAGILRVKRDKFEAGLEHAPNVTVELYCETVAITLPTAPPLVAMPVAAPATPVMKPVSAIPNPARPV